jgi:leader peptidase (prepilin peptidase)/N-methyltransferase
MIKFLFFILGLAFGSFFNVVIYRLPRKKSFLKPSSYCPSCKNPIKWYDNIPLISFILLKGRCRFCQAKISWRYPVVELLTGFIFLFSCFAYNIKPQLFSSLFFLSILLLVSFIDLDTLLIPNRIIIPALGVTFILWLMSVFTSFPFLPLLQGNAISSFLGALISGVLISLIVFLSPLIFGREGMGFGDIKLSFFIGFYLGYYVIVALFISFLLGGFVGIILLSLKRKGRFDEIPFGPFLSLGAFLSLFLAEPIAYWYLNFLR